VPFTQGGETEQAARARRLAGLGRAAVLAEQDLSAGTMRAAIDTALAGPDPDPAAFDLGGAQATARILRSLLR
jgi:predicted glycosyltransferase